MQNWWRGVAAVYVLQGGPCPLQELHRANSEVFAVSVVLHGENEKQKRQPAETSSAPAAEAKRRKTSSAEAGQARAAPNPITVTGLSGATIGEVPYEASGSVTTGTDTARGVTRKLRELLEADSDTEFLLIQRDGTKLNDDDPVRPGEALTMVRQITALPGLKELARVEWGGENGKDIYSLALDKPVAQQRFRDRVERFVQALQGQARSDGLCGVAKGLYLLANNPRLSTIHKSVKIVHPDGSLATRGPVQAGGTTEELEEHNEIEEWCKKNEAPRGYGSVRVGVQDDYDYNELLPAGGKVAVVPSGTHHSQRACVLLGPVASVVKTDETQKVKDTQKVKWSSFGKHIGGFHPSDPEYSMCFTYDRGDPFMNSQLSLLQSIQVVGPVVDGSLEDPVTGEFQYDPKELAVKFELHAPPQDAAVPAGEEVSEFWGDVSNWFPAGADLSPWVRLAGRHPFSEKPMNE
eukprot:g663.t1